MRQRRAPVPITARQIDTFRRELTQRECSPGTVENYIRQRSSLRPLEPGGPCDPRAAPRSGGEALRKHMPPPLSTPCWLG